MAPPTNVPQSTSSDDSRRLWRLAGMGFTLTSEILAGTALGWLLDRALNSGNTWLIVGTIAGLVIGLLTFFRSAIRASREASAQAARTTERMKAEGRLPDQDPEEHDDRSEQPR